MKKTILLVLASASIFTACKKDDEPTTEQKLMQKWNIASTYDSEFYRGVVYKDTTIGVAGEYADFKSDGKVYSYKYDRSSGSWGYDTAV